MRQLTGAAVDEVLDALNDLGSHPPDGEILVTVGTPEITLLGRQQNQMQPVVAE
ncbi:hypothetical protein GCM10020219_013270 [Nonomuraea dietziae]